MDNKAKISVLTGSLGSGKSTVSQLFEKCGARIIDSDLLAREVVAPGADGLEKVIAYFGKNYLLPTGELNRKALGQLVFNDKAKLKALEDILHPLVRELCHQRIKDLTSNSAEPILILCVIPLFFESRFSYPEVQKVIVVSAPKEVCIKRVINRDNCPQELAEKKYNSQLPIEEKERLADYVIHNNNGIDELESQVRSIYEQLTA